MAKRFFDISISLLSIILLSPLFLLIAAASKLISPAGPLLFRQKRYGRNAAVFNLVKFRTLDDNEDPISPFHRLLRQTGLDELPQLFHILAGTMTFVGPRPLDIEEEEIHEMRKRAGIYVLKPGLTGWAQINGGADLEDEWKTKRDEEYKKRQSFGTDMLILLETGRQMPAKREPSEPGKLHVFVAGSKGIPAAYGGFETLVQNLAGKKEDDGIVYHVLGMGKKVPAVVDGACCRYFSSRLPGAAGRMACALRQLVFAINWKIRRPLEKTVVLMLGSRAGLFLPLLRPMFKTFGIRLIGHPDGFEEKRAKWNGPSALIVRASQYALLKYSDVLVFDSKTVRDTYRTGRPGVFIPYGGENRPGRKMEYASWLIDNGLEEGGYFLMVSRAVPENNHALAVRALGGGEVPLVILSDDPDFFGDLGNGNVKIVPPVYDPVLLARIREGSLALIHAHEAGGSNPGLIEALAQNAFVLALDTPCNREVAGDGAVYFEKDEDSLKEAAESATDVKLRERTLALAARRARRFGWKEVVRAYEEVFKAAAERADTGL